MSRDLGPTGGVTDVLYDNNWFGRWLDLMRNQYGYVSGHPTNEVDPLGLQGQPIAFPPPPFAVPAPRAGMTGPTTGFSGQIPGSPIPGNDNLTFLADFLTGTGQTNRVYDYPSKQLDDLINSAGGQGLRDAFFKGGCKNIANYTYGTSEAFLKSPPWSSSAAGQVGGFAGASAINNGDGTVTFTIPNTAGRKSFMYHMMSDRPPGSTGPLRSIMQTFIWTEHIDDKTCCPGGVFISHSTR